MRGTVKQTLGSVNHPILFGEVAVNPGDLVIGDDEAAQGQVTLKPLRGGGEQQALAQQDIAGHLGQLLGLPQNV